MNTNLIKTRLAVKLDGIKTRLAVILDGIKTIAWHLFAPNYCKMLEDRVIDLQSAMDARDIEYENDMDEANARIQELEESLAEANAASKELLIQLGELQDKHTGLLGRINALIQKLG